MEGGGIPPRESLEVLVSAIKALAPQLEPVRARLKQAIDRRAAPTDPNAYSPADGYWSFVAFYDAFVRIRLMLEQNFLVLESLSLLATTRYLFELTVWLKLIAREPRFGLVYWWVLLQTQVQYYRDLRHHLEREISFLRATGDREGVLQRQVLHRLRDSSGQDAIPRALSEVMAEIDASMARSFTIYGDDAKVNGYAFQAQLIESHVLPGVRESIASLEGQIGLFNDNTRTQIRDLIGDRWNWKRQSEAADMGAEYEYIYTFTSKLLHATPASVTTNQKNLEEDEMRILLRYILVRLNDLLAIPRDILAGEVSGAAGTA